MSDNNTPYSITQKTEKQATQKNTDLTCRLARFDLIQRNINVY